MSDGTDIPGAGIVGCLNAAAPWEVELIMAMRLWMDSPQGQAQVWNGFARCFGAGPGRVEMRCLEDLLTRLCTHARRPLVRHGPGCACIGADEAILRLLVGEAARGDLAEAARIASLIVPACHAEPVALMAGQVGEAMQRMARHASSLRPPPARAAPRHLH